MVASLSPLGTMQVYASGRWKREAARKSLPAIDLCVAKASVQLYGARTAGSSSVVEATVSSRCLRGDFCKPCQCISSTCVQWLGSGVSAVPNCGELSLCSADVEILSHSCYILCMKGIFSTYTTEHVCIARRFFGLVGLLLSLQLVVHSTGAEGVVGADEGTDRGKGMQADVSA